MKKKGFTLIELTGVVVIIGLLLLFTLPRIIQNMDNVKEQEYERMLKDLEIAAETYVQSNREAYPELDTVGGRVFVSLAQLNEAKLVRKDMVNPKTGNPIDQEYTVAITKNSNGTLEYEYNDGNGKLDGYVSDNLKLMYDGITAPVGNGWPDVGSNTTDGTMTGFNNTSTSGWQGNYMAFDGVDDKIASSTSVTGDFTVEFSYHKDTNVAQPSNEVALYSCNGDVWGASSTKSGFALYLVKTYENKRFLQMRFIVPPVGESPYSESISQVIEANYPTENLTVTFVSTSTAIQLYINGKYSSAIPFQSFLDRFDVTDMSLAIGNWKTNIFSIVRANNLRVYNKALTADEIATNYKVDKARYGE